MDHLQKMQFLVGCIANEFVQTIIVYSFVGGIFMQMIGKTVKLDHPAVITGSAGVAGKKEAEGPLGTEFDQVYEDTTLGQDSFELAEATLLRDAVTRALEAAGKAPGDVNFILSGDLLDQCTSSCFGLQPLEIPYIGMYGACSTITLTMATAAMLVDGGADCCICSTSSHFCSSERQFRFPLEYGGQRPPTAQWTVTGAGSAVLEKRGEGVKVTHVHIGTVTDYGVTDANNMGAAMAPAAARTIGDFLRDTKTAPQDYDMILTGDLGYTGSTLLYELLEDKNINIRAQHKDCGLLIFDREAQDVGAGGSGCGCAGSVLCSYILKQMRSGRLHRVLAVATGALMSPTSSKQGMPIPGIANAVLLEA